MPVPTETFRNIRKLNLIFLASAVLLLVATVWMILADHGRAWHVYQLDSRKWDEAMTSEAAESARRSDAYQQALREAQDALAAAREARPTEQIRDVDGQIRTLQADIDRLKLPADVEKGKITPTLQRYEQAVIDHGAASEQARALLRDLNTVRQASDAYQKQLAELQSQLDARQAELAELQADEVAMERRIAELQRDVKTQEDRVKELAPSGAAKIGALIRDAPLMDWFNPSLKPAQVVVPDIREEYHFLTVETIDRCMTCHVNIDNPRFAATEQVAFVERQLAMAEGQDVSSVERPFVMLDFWVHAARTAGDAAAGLERVNQKAIWYLEALGGEAPDADGLAARFAEIQLRERGDDAVTRAQWHHVVETYRDDVRQLMRDHLGKEQFARLEELYRRTLIARYNATRREQGLAMLSDSPVLLAHPRFELFVDADSKHPMKTMGCTSCHDGSGQETQFEHTAHTPREAWVDAQTGALVPDFLIGRVGETREITRALRQETSGTRASAPSDVRIVPAANATAEHGSDHAAAGHDDGHRYVHYDVNLNSPGNPAPFAPVADPHGQAGLYSLPGGDEPRLAVRQADFWTRQYGWHVIHYMHWERPMHALQYVESNCARCHTEVFDIGAEAPTLFTGRKLFAQLGCANCHVVEALADDLDVKRVGPSLVHVKEKLDEQMIATWVWSPKAFRPTSNMPHYFMQENNSSPVDVLRTRVEVAAMAHYLNTAEPSAGYYGDQNLPTPAYQPEPAPEAAGDVERGREIFKKVGCMACHTNLDEYGEEWITRNLVARGMDDGQAAEAYGAMSYNQKHWYALEHLADKLDLTGPELSGVGSKLLAGRSAEQAKGWLYDWLRNPRHYSSYTIMPSFRLSADEANDLTTYLLSLKRPGGEGESEYTPGDFTLDENGQAMLRELVAVLRSGRSTLELARADVAAEARTDDDLLLELGQHTIRHYGCAGCHLINGMEAEASACTNLDDWGLKDPHKLAFEYFYHAFDSLREKPIEVWKVAHEGLEADAPEITANSEKIRPVAVHWEHMDLERRPWLYHKLHNSRVYDRGRTTLDGQWNPDQPFDTQQHGVGRPYDKLKMPRFYLHDDQVQALVTYVTSVRKPLVTDRMQNVTDDAGTRVARGRQLATLYNCYGCHNVENNDVGIQQYFHTRNPDGTFDGNALNWAPPRLLGQGAKTQPDWLFSFLGDVHPIRPWLFMRMPSFPLDVHETTGLVDYLAGHSQQLTDELKEALAAIDEFNANFVKQNPDASWTESGWHRAPSLRAQVARLREFAVAADLTTPLDVKLNSPHVDYEYREVLLQDGQTMAEAYSKVLTAVRTLSEAFETTYPYVQKRSADISLERFVRGERLFAELGCMTGMCHRLGDEALLAGNDMLLRTPLPWALPLAAGADPAEGDMEGESDDEYEDEFDDFDDENGMAGDSLTPAIPPDGAPNLARMAGRIQSHWAHWWLPHNGIMLPGNRMVPYFPPDESGELTSFFAMLPDDIRQEKESLYGYTGREQLELLLDFLYAVGPRGYTYTPEGQRMGAADQAEVELTPLERLPAPAVPEATEEPVDGEAEAQTPEAPVAPEPAAAPVAPSAPEPAHSTIELHEAQTPYQGTRVVGQVTFAGRAATRRPVNMGTDAFCAAAHDQPVLSDATEIVNADGTLRYAFLYVKEGLPNQAWEVPSAPAVLDQVGCMYLPHVLGVMAGQTLLVPNSDGTTHNVNMTSARNGRENRNMPARSRAIEMKFTRPEMNITFKCDVHPWMSAFVHVVEHPFFAVSDVQGRFEIKGLPPGTYTIEVVHELRKIRPVTFTIEVKDDTSVRQDVTVGG